MGVEAARARAARRRRRPTPRRAVVLHRRPGLRRQDQRHHRPRRPALDRESPAFDANGAVRSAVGALRATLGGHRHAPRRQRRPPQPACPAAPTRPPVGDGAAALLVGDDGDGAAVLAEVIGGAAPPRSSSTAGARPGDVRSKVWEERFGETRYVPARPGRVGRRAEARRPRGRPGRPRRRHRHPRPGRRRAGQEARASATGSSTTSPATVGNTGAAQPALLLDRRRSRPADARARCIALVVLADGADVLLFRTTDALAVVAPGPPGRRAGRRRRADRLRHLPALARPAARRAAPPARAGPPVGHRRRPLGATGSSASSARPTPPARSTCRRSRATTPRCRWPTPPAPSSPSPIDRLAYSPSPPVVFAVVDFDGGGRLPVELTDVDADEVRIGAPRRADVPQAVHRRRHPQLLLEGDGCSDGHRTGSRTASPSSAWAARPSPSTGTRASTTCCSTPPARRSPSAGVTKDDVDAYWLGTAQCGMSRDAPGQAAAARGQARHPRREHLRHRLRGAAPGRLRGGVGRLRRGHGGRRREGEGLGLPGPQRVPGARPTARSARSPPRPCSRWSRPPTPSATACRWTSSRPCSPASRRRTTTTAPATRGPSSAARCRSSRSSRCRRWPASCRCSTAPAWPTARPRPSCAGPRTPTATPTRRST